MRQRRPISHTSPRLAFLQLPRLGEIGEEGRVIYTHTDTHVQTKDLESLPKFPAENALTSSACADRFLDDNPFGVLNYTFQCQLSLLIFKIGYFWGLPIKWLIYQF